MNKEFPYAHVESLRVWKVLDQGIQDLAANGDLDEKTERKYIVGYLAKLLLDAELIAELSKQSPAKRARSGSH